MVARAVGIVGIGVLALACAGGTGEPAADLQGRRTWPRRDAGPAVTFDYPGNWRVSEQVEGEDVTAALTWTVETPGSAILVVQDLPDALSFDQTVDIYLTALRDQVQPLGMTFTETDRAPVDRALAGEAAVGLRVRYGLEVLGIDVPHTVDLYRVARGGRALVVVSQVADEDRAQVEPGFDLVLDSLAW